MRHMHSLTAKCWPSTEIVNELFEHFLSLERSKNARLQKDLSRNRTVLFSQLKWNRYFGIFWNLVQEMYPEKEDYFASLMDAAKPYKPWWLLNRYDKQVQPFQTIGEENCAYNRFQFRKEFEEMSRKEFEEMLREEKSSLKIHFEDLRHSTYHLALKKEAQRLNVAFSEVRPIIPVLPLEPNYDPRFVLAALPDEILVKTMAHLDSPDIFNMTRVCKRWKDLVHNNSEKLKRAEHAVTTHLVTFTDWMDPPSTFHNNSSRDRCRAAETTYDNFVRQYCHFSWGLVRWCCGISNNLETLILEHPVSYSNVATLLKSCPNLKNLQLGVNSAPRDFTSGRLLSRKVHLSNLKAYLCTEIDEDDPPTQEIKADVLCSVDHLAVLRTSIQDEYMASIQFVRPVTEVFRNLTALDLTRFTDNVLQILATIPNLQLKYLRLQDVFKECDLNVPQYEIIAARYRDAFHQLLPKLRKLEVLETRFVPGVTNETIQLLTDLELNLQFAVLAHSFVRTETLHFNCRARKHADPLDPNLLREFRDGLLLRNPELDLSDFHFLVRDEEARNQLLAADIGFTFPGMRVYYLKDYALSGLCYPAMRNRLNINF